MKRTFRIEEDSLQYRFLQSRAKVQLYGGGFANGKTAASCIKALQIARDYPGSNGLIARATYPKLNDTIRKEFLKWCPKHWIKSFPMSQNASNTCTLTNGTTINFRYIAQQGKMTAEATTSNLLSATYDWIVVDQMEDPEISEKDFLDLLGRLRGSTPYTGDDKTMPNTGPRWFIITCNPTRNWLYRKLVKPLHLFKRTGIVSDDLLIDDSGKPMIELFEGATYENKANLAPDFIKTLETAYTGQMRERFLLGQWAAYEGLVYPTFSEDLHVVRHQKMLQYLRALTKQGYKPTWLEGYDHGYAVPACYLFGFVDPHRNVHVIDGFYGKERTLEQITTEIRRARRDIAENPFLDNTILADPALFKRGAGDKQTVGVTVADLFYDNGLGVKMTRGNNNILNGITKVRGYLEPLDHHRSPYTGKSPAPHLYFSDKLDFLVGEIVDYYWRKNTDGTLLEEPNDRNDHAMDTLKYMLSRQPQVGIIMAETMEMPAGFFKWYEREVETRYRKARYN